MRITVRYPASPGEISLRTSLDWERGLTPTHESDGCAIFEFDFEGLNLEFKAVLRRDDKDHWSRGPNYITSRHDLDREVFPYFFGEETGLVTDLMTVEGPDRAYSVRAYLPAGYDENTLRTYPVLYMQDGRNLFKSEEAFGGREWQVDETLERLERMNAVRRVIVVGVTPNDRMRDYTTPGYHDYGRFFVETLKPFVDGKFRTRVSPRETVVMGSSLGGVVSLHLAWQYPEVFGGAACLSSTFGYEDDLFERIAREPRRNIRIYLDSGWPRDNFDATNAMRDLLVHRGYRLGDDLLQFSFPEGLHNEGSWAGRIHVPFQFFFGRAWVAGRG
jgi:predicted alpha/beta superfamily hydrolase